MAKDNVVTQESFDVLLAWLDQTSREAAGIRYEKIRQRLIRIFLGRGCFEAEDLADETINRVVLKLPQIAENYTGEPVLYFYGVAHKIHLEWLRKQKRIKQVPFEETKNSIQEIESETGDAAAAAEYECLETCLKTLSEDHRRLIVKYYRKEKSAKIENRKGLAEELKISVNALQIKASRIRANLKECVQNCVDERNSSR
jgi:RNA polymerase sigma factor (sigma-70 family)